MVSRTTILGRGQGTEDSGTSAYNTLLVQPGKLVGLSKPEVIKKSSRLGGILRKADRHSDKSLFFVNLRIVRDVFDERQVLPFCCSVVLQREVVRVRVFVIRIGV